jgi:hypothetical protein
MLEHANVYEDIISGIADLIVTAGNAVRERTAVAQSKNVGYEASAYCNYVVAASLAIDLTKPHTPIKQPPSIPAQIQKDIRVIDSSEIAKDWDAGLLEMLDMYTQLCETHAEILERHRLMSSIAAKAD